MASSGNFSPLALVPQIRTEIGPATTMSSLFSLDRSIETCSPPMIAPAPPSGVSGSWTVVAAPTAVVVVMAPDVVTVTRDAGAPADATVVGLDDTSMVDPLGAAVVIGWPTDVTGVPTLVEVVPLCETDVVGKTVVVEDPTVVDDATDVVEDPTVVDDATVVVEDATVVDDATVVVVVVVVVVTATDHIAYRVTLVPALYVAPGWYVVPDPLGLVFHSTKS